jgi:uncharacterized membrane protein YkoI
LRPEKPKPPTLSIADIIAALEKLRADESVLDVSFEPKDGQPAYAVRTYANGKVWDGQIDGLTGAAIGDGTVTDESALDDEDKAELAASIHVKITLRQAIETAEKANDGRALNAGLEQVRGRVVWDILFQKSFAACDSNSPSRRRDDRIIMWGTTPLCVKLTGDSGNGFEAH